MIRIMFFFSLPLFISLSFSSMCVCDALHLLFSYCVVIVFFFLMSFFSCVYLLQRVALRVVIFVSWCGLMCCIVLYCVVSFYMNISCVALC